MKVIKCVRNVNKFDHVQKLRYGGPMFVCWQDALDRIGWKLHMEALDPTGTDRFAVFSSAEKESCAISFSATDDHADGQWLNGGYFA